MRVGECRYTLFLAMGLSQDETRTHLQRGGRDFIIVSGFNFRFDYYAICVFTG